jgi:aldehyde:ferredoxin oxidoreductase
VLFANVCNDLAHFNGRGGMGAVMGSKNLKAVAVRTRGTQMAYRDADTIRGITKSIAQRMKDHSLAWGLHISGTPAGVEGLNAAGFLPTNNWRQGQFSGAERIGAGAMEHVLVRRKGCYSCPLRCKRVVSYGGDMPVDAAYGGPELETLGSLGSNLCIDDLNIISKANEMCNDYTMDTITLGMTIAFAMECYEHGLITKSDTGGIDLRFGNKDILLPLIEMTAHRRGFGKMLAMGSQRLAEHIGPASFPMRVTTKGQEPPVHDPRWKAGISMQFALSYNGTDHWVAEHDQLYKDADSLGLKALAPLGLFEPVDVTDTSWRKVRMFFYTHMLVNTYDCIGACGLGTAPRSILGLNELLRILTAATGWDTSLWEIMKAGERAFTMQRLFNLREGFGKKDDCLPPRFYETLKTPSGDAACDETAVAAMVDMFYDMAGWDEDGRPRPGKLHELGLGAYAP